MASYLDAASFIDYLKTVQQRKVQPYRLEGCLTRMVGLILEAKGCRAPIGARFAVITEDGRQSEAELVGFGDDVSYLLPLDYSQGLVCGARVIPLARDSCIGVGEALLGRVVDAGNRPIDGKGELLLHERYPLQGRRINPLERALVSEPLDVGVRVLNSLLTLGKGQRVGLFSSAGVGKSVLLGMIAKATQADVIVMALVGERGREVREFVDKTLDEHTRKRAVVVASPADDPPLLRFQGALTATTIAEYFRDQRRDVLLIMDSLTRFAQAQREMALSIGEPPASRSYPPSVFAKIPHLAERAGRLLSGGSITAIYTVLTESDDMDDPVADCAMGTLDGHIVLSRSLAEQGIYPAIDILASISRTMPSVINKTHQASAIAFKKYYAHYMQHQDLISIGAYKSGSRKEVDDAIAIYPHLRAFIEQEEHIVCDYENSKNQLFAITQS